MIRYDVRWCFSKDTETERPGLPSTCGHVVHLGQNLCDALSVSLDRNSGDQWAHDVQVHAGLDGCHSAHWQGTVAQCQWHIRMRSTLPYGLVWEGHDPWEKRICWNCLKAWTSAGCVYTSCWMTGAYFTQWVESIDWPLAEHTLRMFPSSRAHRMRERERDMALSDTPARSNSTMQRRTTTSTTSVHHYLTHIIWLQSDVSGHTQTARAMETRTVLRSSSRSNTKYSITDSKSARTSSHVRENRHLFAIKTRHSEISQPSWAQIHTLVTP